MKNLKHFWQWVWYDRSPRSRSAPMYILTPRLVTSWLFCISGFFTRRRIK